MKILFVGDIMGSAGRKAFVEIAPRYKEEGKADFIIVNAENAAAGKGLTPKLAAEFLAAGADVITLGDHAYDQREIMPYLDQSDRVIRPINFAEGCPGKGMCSVDTPVGIVTVVSLLGRVFLPPMDCPFRKMDGLLRLAARHSKIVFVDFHAEATSEKQAMGWHLAGRVTAVCGTHTHVQTSDERILDGGTAFITDAGMTGSKKSVIGCEIEPVLKRFLTGLPVRFEPAKEDVSLEGVLIECDRTTGKALSIVRVRERCDG